MEELSDEKLTELRAAFDVFDKDKSGSISIKELGTMLRTFGQNLTKLELIKMIEEIDENKDGTVDFKEFLYLMVEYPKSKEGDNMDILLEAFKVFDRDNNKKITSHELRYVMNNLEADLNESELEDMIKEFDVDGDGEIDEEEFISLMTNK